MDPAHWYEKLFATSSIGIAMVDATAQFRLVNPGCSIIHGRPAGTMIGHQVAEFMSPESRRIFQSNFPQLQQGIIVEGTLTIQQPQGTVVTVVRQGIPIMAKDGSFEGAVLFDRDISIEVKATEDVRHGELKYRAIVESITTGLLVLDEDNNIVDANPAVTSLMRCSANELIEEKADHLFHDGQFPDFTPPSSPDDTTKFSVRTVLKRHDGSTFPAVVSVISFMFHEKPHVLLMLDDASDEEAFKLMQKAQRHIAEHFGAAHDPRDLVEAIHETLMDASIAGGCALYTVNHETQTHAFQVSSGIDQRKADEVVTHMLSDESHADLAQGTMSWGMFHEDLVPTTPPRPSQATAVLLPVRRSATAPNMLLLVNIDAQPLQRDMAPLFENIATQCGNVLDRIDADQQRLDIETKVQQAQKLESLGVLAGGIAHDFNNLLMGILGNASLALLELPNNSPTRNYLQQIETTSMRAADLIRQMLAYSGKGRFVVEDINISLLVQEMSDLLRVSLSKDAVLRLDLQQDIPSVRADATQMRQVVMNLITNASDAVAGVGGVITAATGTLWCDREYLNSTYLDDSLPEGEYVFFEVTDTGSGMDEQTRARVFDPFFTTKFAGRGLGLAAVLGIVRGHHGAIRIYSEIDKGSCFKVLLPSGEKHTAPKKTSNNPPQKSSERAHALVVDDDELVRSIARGMLEKLGLTVSTARDGHEALDVFRADPSRYDVVLLDLTMPRMNGEECFRGLRKIRKDIKIVLSSGYNEQVAVQKFTGRGLAGFIQKPYRVESLGDVLERVLGRTLQREPDDSKR